MKQSDLAQLLGVSQSMVSRYTAAGMPTDSLEAAREWRGMHVDIARRKEHRLRTRPAKAAPAPAIDPVYAAMGRAEWALHELAERLAAGEVAPDSSAARLAMRAVPEHGRALLQLPFSVMDYLCAPLLAELDAMGCMDDEHRAAAAAMDPHDAEYVGGVMYAFACGELVLRAA